VPNDESEYVLVSDSLVPADDAPEWEKELAAELQEYEIVVDRVGIDEELEQEILKEIGEDAKWNRSLTREGTVWCLVSHVLMGTAAVLSSDHMDYVSFYTNLVDWV